MHISEFVDWLTRFVIFYLSRDVVDSFGNFNSLILYLSKIKTCTDVFQSVGSGILLVSNLKSMDYFLTCQRK